MAISLQVGDICKVKAPGEIPSTYIGVVMDIQQFRETRVLVKSIKMLDQDISCFYYNFEDLEVIGNIDLSMI